MSLVCYCLLYLFVIGVDTFVFNLDGIGSGFARDCFRGFSN